MRAVGVVVAGRCDSSRSIDLEVAGGVPGGAVTRFGRCCGCWLGGEGLRPVAERAGVDRKTARRYVDAAVAAGLVRDGGEEQLTDELIGAVVAAVRPARRAGPRRGVGGAAGAGGADARSGSARMSCS